MTTSEAVEYARMAVYAYKDFGEGSETRVILDGWEPVNDPDLMMDDPLTGFHAEVLTRGGELVIAFRGTDGLADVPADLAIGINSAFNAQYIEALTLVASIINDPYYAGREISFTGHSLGGGLAALMAATFNKKAIVFDPAPYVAGASATNALAALVGAPLAAMLAEAAATLGYSLEVDPGDFASYIDVYRVAGEFLDIGDSLYPAKYTEKFKLENENYSYATHGISYHSAALLLLVSQSIVSGISLADVSKLLSYFVDDLLNDDISGLTTDNGRSANHLMVELANSSEALEKFHDHLMRLTSGAASQDKTFQQSLERLLLQTVRDEIRSGVYDFAGDDETQVKFDLRTIQQTDGQIFGKKEIADYVQGLACDQAGEVTPVLPDFKTITVQAGGDEGTSSNGSGDTLASDLFVGGKGTDRFDGGAGDDVAFGGEAGDELRGGTGDDYLFGCEGTDTLEGGDGDDYLYGGEGDDSINGGNGQDTLWGGDGKDNLDGGAEKDTLYGDGGADTLLGANGDDTLYGGDGGDSLDGGEGADQLEGGAGYDTYLTGNGDIISDSDGSGTVRLSGLTLRGGKAPGDDDSGGSNTVVEGEVYTGDSGETYTFAGGTLTVSNSGGGEITIENWKQGQLGIKLKNEDDDKNDPPDNYASPLVLDLDGDGIETTLLETNSVYFDIDEDGIRERTAWVSPDDGLLALDQNGDGRINDVGELFGATSSTTDRRTWTPLSRLCPTCSARGGFATCTRP